MGKKYTAKNRKTDSLTPSQPDTFPATLWISSGGEDPAGFGLPPRWATSPPSTKAVMLSGELRLPQDWDTKTAVQSVGFLLDSFAAVSKGTGFEFYRLFAIPTNPFTVAPGAAKKPPPRGPRRIPSPRRAGNLSGDTIPSP